MLRLRLGTLVERVAFATGDAQRCRCCEAVLNMYSKLRAADDSEPDGAKVWNCEFCGTLNELGARWPAAGARAGLAHAGSSDIAAEEVPTADSMDYILEHAAAAVGADGASHAPATNDSLVVFAIDISGSMCVTSEVPGHFELK